MYCISVLEQEGLGLKARFGFMVAFYKHGEKMCLENLNNPITMKRISRYSKQLAGRHDTTTVIAVVLY